MKRRVSSVLLCLLSLLWGACEGAKLKDMPTPNIVFIYADDLGWSDLAVQGSKYYQTPHLDKISREGMTFTNAYAPAANCAPSRACWITGQYTPRHGVYTVKSSARGAAKYRKIIPTENTIFIKESNQTVFHALKAKGYTTGFMGKWHVSADPGKNGVDHYLQARVGKKTYIGPFAEKAKTNIKNIVDKDKYIADFLTTNGIEFLKKNKNNKFFLYMGYHMVHTPIVPDKKVLPRYKDAKPTKRHNNVNYAAMISSLDDNVGRIMKALKELGLDNKTMVVFSSDNGGAPKIHRLCSLKDG